MLLVTALLLLSGAGARAQVADAENAFMSRIAQERAARGLPGYAFAADLQAVARRQAQRMADRGAPFHNPNLGSEVQNWSMLAENVGYGPDVEHVHQAFMASSQHRGSILSDDLTQVGIGVVRGGDGRLWVAQVFRRPAGAAPPATPPPPPPPPTTVAPPPVQQRAAPPTTPAPPPAAPAPAPAVTLPPPAAPPSPPGAGASGGLAAAAPTVDLLRATVASPAAAAPDLRELADRVPGAAWVGAFLLAAVVGLQGRTLRRLGLVR